MTDLPAEPQNGKPESGWNMKSWKMHIQNALFVMQ